MTTSTLPEARFASRLNDRTIPGTFALLLGFGFIFLVGFAPMPTVHNAAHDTRHTAAFPCH